MNNFELFTPDAADPLRSPASVARDVLGTAMNARTFVRQIVKGVKVGGRCVKLPAIRAGGSFKTTARAYRFFLEQLNAPAEEAADEAAAPRSVSKRLAASRAAEAELVKEGA